VLHLSAAHSGQKATRFGRGDAQCLSRLFLKNGDGARDGHYFDLYHINHNGVQNIMFSNAAGNSYADWGLFGYYLNAEPYFTSRDKRNVWRFIVDQLRNEL
jgi:hypothetical protein